MKKYFVFFAMITVLAASLLTSCKKDDDDDNPLLSTASMTCQVDGNSWAAVTRVTRHSLTTQTYTITGTDASGAVIVITIRGEAVGTYSSSTSIDSLNAQVGAVYQPDASSPATDNYFSKSGTVTISSLDETNKKVSGTFSFSLTKSGTAMSITNGKFTDLSYSESSDSN
ncbi:MAG: DUF6252 family protein [Bacteroidota bacterium]